VGEDGDGCLLTGWGAGGEEDGEEQDESG